jgi:hypothetical protein
MDELFGDIKDLSDSLSRLSLLPPDFEGKEKVTPIRFGRKDFNTRNEIYVRQSDTPPSPGRGKL